MNHRTRTRTVRRLAASVTFAALAGGLALPLLAAPVAHAVEETETRRLSGDDRYETAAAVATDTFPDGAATVVLATGEGFADALAANGLAGAVGAPILLTPSASLHDATAAALTDLGAETVLVMGGTAAVSQAVEDELTKSYTVERVQGQDRYETAAAAGAAIAGTDDGIPVTPDGIGSTSDGVTAVLANGLNFPDAVSGGPVAYAGRLPVLLVTADDVPAATTTALEELGIEHVLLVGGTAVISESVRGTLEDGGYSTERLAGNDRYATNVAVNAFAQDEAGFEFGGPTAYLSTGTNFADALTGGPAAGASASPLVLTAPGSLPAATQDYLEATGNAIDEIVAIGGTVAIAADTLAAAADAARVDDNAAFSVTPTATEILQQSSSGLNSDGAREFTARGLVPETEYVIAVLDAETVEPGDPDAFSSYSLSGQASTSIESVNGQPVGSAGGPGTLQETAAADADGTITFTIDATAHDDVVPVVYEDADADGELDLANGQAAELYGLGGRTTWVPAEADSNAAGASYEALTVLAHDAELGFFIAEVVIESQIPGAPASTEERTFFFDTRDRFRVEGATATPSVFASRLSDGDVVAASYFQDLQSQFDITTDTGSDVDGIAEGTTVATNAGLKYLNGGDVWMLHFSEPVNVSPSASITVRGPSDSGDLTTLTLTNGSSSTWAVDGRTITITVGSAADVAEVNYGESTRVTDLAGVTAANGSAVDEADLADNVLEDDGPELMTATTTCDAGDSSCTIEFNEPVTVATAEARDRYTFDRPGDGDAPSLLSASIGADGRTLTFTFAGALAAGDVVRPVGAGGPVTDDDTQQSTQELVVFVR